MTFRDPVPLMSPARQPAALRGSRWRSAASAGRALPVVVLTTCWPGGGWLGGWQVFVWVEEGDCCGLGGGPLPVGPLDFQIVARAGEFGWDPHVADVAL